jgi:uncharacterized YkwD family protein
MKSMHKLLPLLLAAIVMAAPVSASAYWNGYYWYNSNTPTARTSLASTSTSAPRTTEQTTNTAQSSVEQTILRLLNQERTQRGLAPLQLDSSLSSVARAKSQDMVSKRYFSHTSPTYGSPAQMLTRFGIRYNLYGENIAQGGDATRIHAMWMASAGHRANMLNAKFTHVGIGVVSGSSGLTATQLFIAR